MQYFTSVLLAALVLTPSIAFAALPPGTDLNSPIHEWFEKQYSKKGAWCCNISDGHILEEEDWRETPAGYEVRLGNTWHAIPDGALRDPYSGPDHDGHGPNPTGQAIIWYTGSTMYPNIYCFAPGTQY